jgi:hypothetical protein
MTTTGKKSGEYIARPVTEGERCAHGALATEPCEQCAVPPGKEAKMLDDLWSFLCDCENAEDRTRRTALTVASQNHGDGEYRLARDVKYRMVILGYKPANNVVRGADPAAGPRTSPPPCSVVHQCPPDGAGVMPCCNRTPFEVSRTDRMTTDADAVTCKPNHGREVRGASPRNLHGLVGDSE